MQNEGNCKEELCKEKGKLEGNEWKREKGKQNIRTNEANQKKN